ncbi:YdeI/OmpD-associated family protein [Flavobacterium aquaticum]|uniref:YdeI/OmpD-associated family protein n=1 Tax=Flavobacterium proteolyticum TaxID=2911683 RepID=A0ABR9WTQ8_9FLAO|nr:YdeI/OmpD-associated family protein [Flavobacterium proteolyticum]
MTLEKDNKWNKTNQWENELEQLHAIIRKTPLVETTKWGGPVYTYNNKNVLGIGGFKSYFGIWFYNGVFLKDEKKLLINANEENTKSLRQMRFNSVNEIDEKLILAYIKEAIEIEEKGLAIPKEKKETIIPELLQKELDRNLELSSKFNSFSPYKQREFIEYITSAKQEKTQMTRLEKVITMILEGRGLNDKYRA